MVLLLARCFGSWVVASLCAWKKIALKAYMIPWRNVLLSASQLEELVSQFIKGKYSKILILLIEISKIDNAHNFCKITHLYRKYPSHLHSKIPTHSALFSRSTTLKLAIPLHYLADSSFELWTIEMKWLPRGKLLRPDATQTLKKFVRTTHQIHHCFLRWLYSIMYHLWCPLWMFLVLQILDRYN